MRTVREISQNEMMYLDMQDISNSFAIQYLLEYGRVDADIVQEMLLSAITRVPEIWVCKRGSKWVLCQETPQVQEIYFEEGEVLDLPVFRQKIDYARHSLETFVIHGKQSSYVLIRFLHSVVDGQGALLFMQEFFQQKTSLLPNNQVNDEQFVKHLSLSKDKMPLNGHFMPNVKNISTRDFVWRSIALEGYYPGIIARLAKILSVQFKQNTARFLIPVDIRRHGKAGAHLGNLTLPIFLNVSKYDTWRQINGQLLYALKEKKELQKAAVYHFNYRSFPAWLRRMALRVWTGRIDKLKAYPVAGIISHLGRIDAGKWKLGDEALLSFTSLPVPQPMGVFSVVIAEYGRQTRLCISYPKQMFNFQTEKEWWQQLEMEFCGEKKTLQGPERDWQENFLQCMERTARAHLNAPAVYDGKVYSYADLLRASRHVAGALKAVYIRPGDVVLLRLPRSFALVAAVWGILRVGGVFVLNEPEQSCPVHADFEINEKNIAEFLQGPAIEDLFYSYKEEDELYRVFTSGSTGAAKAVRVSMKNFSNYILWAAETYAADFLPVMPLFTSLNVDLTLTSLFLPLVTGGCIKVFSAPFSVWTLEDIYQDEDINLIKCTPSHLRLYSEKMSCHKAKALIVGGENFPVSLAAGLLPVHRYIVNEYGPAETTVGSCFHFVTSENVKSGFIPIGRPIANTQISLFLSASKAGERGEICIWGHGVSLGYAGLSSKSFALRDGRPSYATGDIAWWSADGLVYEGRQDEQLKINGYRIESAEICARIKENPEIKDVFVLQIKGGLVAFVVGKNKIDFLAIRKYLQGKLPSYAVPQYIFQVQSLPLSSNGKTDKAALIKQAQEHLRDLKNTTPITVSSLRKKLQGWFEYAVFSDQAQSLYEAGLDSVMCLDLLYRLSQGVAVERREIFIQELLPQIQSMPLDKLEEKTQQYGWKDE